VLTIKNYVSVDQEMQLNKRAGSFCWF